jgi:peptide deformylase
MFSTLRSNDYGVGLAAPQINIGKKLIIVEFNNKHNTYLNIKELPPMALFNPSIKYITKDGSIKVLESCLSIPNLVGIVSRWRTVHITYLDNNAQKRILKATGFLAALFQHEIDHLYGKLFIHRMTEKQIQQTLVFQQEYEQYKLYEKEEFKNEIDIGDWSYLN